MRENCAITSNQCAKTPVKTWKTKKINNNYNILNVSRWSSMPFFWSAFECCYKSFVAVQIPKRLLAHLYLSCTESICVFLYMLMFFHAEVGTIHKKIVMQHWNTNGCSWNPKQVMHKMWTCSYISKCSKYSLVTSFYEFDFKVF